MYIHIIYIYYHHTYIYAYCGILWCLDWEVGNISHHAWQNQYLSLNWICQKSNSRKNAHKISSFAVDQNSFPPRYPGAIASRVHPILWKILGVFFQISPYCWWKKSCHVNNVIFDIYHINWLAGFLPSTTYLGVLRSLGLLRSFPRIHFPGKVETSS